jgi:hypothetical protein
MASRVRSLTTLDGTVSSGVLCQSMCCPSWSTRGGAGAL